MSESDGTYDRSVTANEAMRLRNLAFLTDLPVDVVQRVEEIGADLKSAQFGEREWRDKAQDKIRECDELERANQLLRADRPHWVEKVADLEAERDSLIAYLGETADAIENHNVKRKQVAALLRKTAARYE